MYLKAQLVLPHPCALQGLCQSKLSQAIHFFPYSSCFPDIYVLMASQICVQPYAARQAHIYEE